MPSPDPSQSPQFPQFPQFPERPLAPELPELDPAFVTDFTAYDEDLTDGQRWSTWWDVDPLNRGPEPQPAWLVTSHGAVDTDLGVLKTGKEADVVLLEREDPHDAGSGVVMAAKRYRSREHSHFHRSALYTEGRSTKRSRDQRAIKRKSTFGREVASGEWAASEWNALVRCWHAGLPVPYPVQLDGTEILMEWITVDGESGAETAPRLAQSRPGPDLLLSYFEQAREILAVLAQEGLVHGDLSPYNVLAAGERLVVIDLPQVVDLVGNPQAAELLLRDCTNLCTWFRRRGLDPTIADEQALLAELLAHAF